MRIKADNLAQHLEKGSPDILIVSGDEPLLVQESADRFRKACRKTGFTERLAYTVTKGFDWSELESHTQSLSLFGEQKLIELQWQNLPEDKGRKLLKSWAENPPEDCRLLITAPRIAANTLNTKWFSAIENHALHITIWPISFQELPQWVTRRLQSQGFRPTKGAVKALCENVEGNLLAAVQEIEKLSLLHPAGDLDETEIIQSVSDSSHYSVFELMSEILHQQTRHALHILRTLEAEGTAPTIVLWTLSRDIRTLGRLRRQTEPAASCLKKSGIPKSRWKHYEQAAQRISPARLMRAHSYCREADEAVKGLGQESPWIMLQNACLLLCNHDEPGHRAQAGNRR